MSSPKYATMTASLLARKGDAAPSVLTPSIRPLLAAESAAMVHDKPALHGATVPPPFPTTHPIQSRPFAPVRPLPAPAADASDKPRRIVFLIDHNEMEKLDIAAIKKGVTRHDIVREALESYFKKLASELPEACNCIANANCCR